MSWLSRLVTPPLRPAVAAGSPLAAGARRHRSLLRPGPVIRHGLSLIATPPLLGPPAERHSWVAAAETLRGPLRSPTTIDAPSRGAPVQPLQPRTPTEPPADAPRPPASSPAATQATTRRRRSATADVDPPRPLAGDRPAGTGRVRPAPTRRAGALSSPPLAPARRAAPATAAASALTASSLRYSTPGRPASSGLRATQVAPITAVSTAPAAPGPVEGSARPLAVVGPAVPGLRTLPARPSSDEFRPPTVTAPLASSTTAQSTDPPSPRPQSSGDRRDLEVLPAPTRVVPSGAPAAGTTAGPPRISIEIGRIEIRSTPRPAASPARRVVAPRDHVIDPHLPFGGRQGAR